MPAIQEWITQIDALYSRNLQEVEGEFIMLIERALEDFPAASLERVVLYNELGGYFRHTGRFTQSEEAFLQAIDVFSNLPPAHRESPNYATTLNNLAGLYRLMGDYNKASRLFDEVLNLFQNIGSIDGYLYASALNNAGLVSQNLRDYSKALDLHTQAYAIVEKLPRDYYLLATTLLNMSNPLAELGQRQEALNYIQTALCLCEKGTGVESPQYAAILNMQAKLRIQEGDNSGAEESLLRSLDICVKCKGWENPETAEVLKSLGRICLAANRTEEAFQYLKQASKTIEALYPPEHSEVGDIHKLLKHIQKKVDKQQ